MASVVISTIVDRLSSAETKSHTLEDLYDLPHPSEITALDPEISNVRTVRYSSSKVYGEERFSTVAELLPFRVRFTNIGVPLAYANVPGIGLQVIEVNNYIL